jgi:hypothetical protein
MNEFLSATVYAVGWVLFVWAQAHNSLLSKTNSLPDGWTGYRKWLQIHASELAIRAFFSGLGYGFIVHSIASTVQHVGFQVTGAALAGVAGFSANTLCYQFIGLFPGLRAEVADIAPPSIPASNSGNVAVAGTSSSPLPKPPTGT